MFLIGHAAVGLNCTTKTKNVFLAFLISFFLHFLVDAIPHGDEAIGAWARGDGHGGVLRLSIIMMIDLSLIAGSYAWVVWRTKFHWSQLFAIAGACVPDLAWGFESFMHRSIFGPFTAWHNAIHNFLHLNLPLWLGLTLQAIVTIWLWRRLARRVS